MRYLVKQVKLFNSNLINLIDYVDTRCVNSVSFDNINKVICSCVASKLDGSIGNLIFMANGLDSVLMQLSHLNIL